MSLWKSTDQANAAPKFLGVLAKDKAYAQTAAVTTTGTFTQGSSNITALGTTSGVSVNQLVTSNTVAVTNGFGPGTVMQGVMVTQVINSSAVAISAPFLGTTSSGANVSFKNTGVRGQNLYGNTTVGAFQNGAAVGVFNVGNQPNILTITATTASGSNTLTSPQATFANTQTGATLTNGSNVLSVIATAPLFINQSIYSATPGFANGVGITNIINSTAVQMSSTFTGTTNATATVVFSNIAIGYVASGNNLPVGYPPVYFQGSISNGSIGQTGNTLVVTGMNFGTGIGTIPPLQIGSMLNVGTANVYITSMGTAGTPVPGYANGTGSVGTYGLSANLSLNAAAAASISGGSISMNTVVASVVSINSTAIVLSSNAIGVGVGNNVTFGSYEKTRAAKGFNSGWVRTQWGTGPLTGGVVNAASTTNFANGETIVVSGGSANGLLVVTSNATGNMASVAAVAPGAGFTNAGSTTQTYSRQLHLANVTVTNTSALTGFVAGDQVKVTCSFALFSFTGVISQNILTASSVTGTITIGNIITGTGVAAGTQVLAQLSGTAGGAGTYLVSGVNASVASTAMQSTGQITIATANITATGSISNATIQIVNPGLFTSGLTTSNLVCTYTNATGGAGTGTGGTVTFAGVYATVSANAASGTVTPTLGGKSGRIYNENLVSLHTTKNDNPADNGAYPNS